MTILALQMRSVLKFLFESGQFLKESSKVSKKLLKLIFKVPKPRSCIRLLWFFKFTTAQVFFLDFPMDCPFKLRHLFFGSPSDSFSIPDTQLSTGTCWGECGGSQSHCALPLLRQSLRVPRRGILAVPGLPTRLGPWEMFGKVKNPKFKELAPKKWCLNNYFLVLGR